MLMQQSKFKPFLPYMGGKRKLANQIIQKFTPHDTYIEVFAGGAAVLFAKEQSKIEVINDLNSNVANLYRVIRFHLEEFIKEYKWILISREQWEQERMKRPETQTDIQRAASYYYQVKLSFSSRGQHFGVTRTTKPRLNLLRIEEELSQAHLRLARVTVEKLTWQKCIDMYDYEKALFYLDPPYWQLASYEIPFAWDEYEQLKEKLLKLKGKFIMSLNGHEDIIKLFDKKYFKIDKLDHKYTLSLGKPTEANEILITKK